MSPVKKIISLEQEARKFGFDWPNHTMILDQIKDECREVQEALEGGARDHLQEEMGDLLHATIGLCVFLDLDVEQTLEKTYRKFSGRMEKMKELTRKKGLQNLQGQSTDFMMDLWKQAKQGNPRSPRGGF